MVTRRERVILELEDNFSSGMARAAAATALLDKSLNSLSGSAVRSRRDIDHVNEPLPVLARNSSLATGSINQLTGRLRLMADAAAILGPALVPIGAAAVPALAAMSTQLLLTGAAAGTAVLAFKGMGEGLKALNTYQLAPTAANFQALQIAMQGLGPAGANFARFLDGIAPKFKQLQLTARGGLFPGLEDGITALLPLLPQVNRVVSEISEAMGQLASEAGAGIAGAGFTDFFNYLESDAKPILVEMGRTIGNFAEGLANMVVAFSPLTSDFSGGLLEMSRAFSEWTDSLGDNESFQSFLSYVQSAAPKVLDFVGALAEAFASIAAAAAPVGNVILPILTQMLRLVADIADSPLGTVFVAAAAGLATYSRAAGLAAAASTRLGIAGTSGLARFNAISSRLGQGAAGLGLVAVAMTDLDDKAGVSNTAMLTLAGTMAGPWGAAAGFAVGATLDIAAANDDLTAAVERATRAFDSNNVDEQTASLKNLKTTIEDTKKAADFSDAATSSPFANVALLNVAKAGFLHLTDAIGGAEDKLDEFQSRSNVASGLQGLLIGPLNLTSEAFDAATQSAQQFSRAISHAMGILDRRAALRDARNAVRDFNKEMRDAPKDVKKGTRAYDDIKASLDNIARTSLTAASHLKGMNRVNFLDKQRDQFIDAAKKMGLTAKQAQALADKLHLVDKTDAKPKITADTALAELSVKQFRALMSKAGSDHAKPQITVDTNGAAGIISGVAGALAGLDGNTANTYIYTHRIETKEKRVLADGGLVIGPGGPRDDQIPAMLSNGEFVINAAAASQNLGLLQQINAQKFANGGMVQRVPSSVTSGSTHVTFGTVNGTLTSPEGFTATVSAIAESAAVRKIEQHNRFQRIQDRD